MLISFVMLDTMLFDEWSERYFRAHGARKRRRPAERDAANEQTAPRPHTLQHNAQLFAA